MVFFNFFLLQLHMVSGWLESKWPFSLDLGGILDLLYWLNHRRGYAQPGLVPQITKTELDWSPTERKRRVTTRFPEISAPERLFWDTFRLLHLVPTGPS